MNLHDPTKALSLLSCPDLKKQFLKFYYYVAL